MGRLMLRRTVLLGLVTAMAVAFLRMSAGTPRGESANHRDAPLIGEDPVVDNADFYVFVSTEPGREEYVTIISNWIPLQAPADDNQFYHFTDAARYDIKIDVPPSPNPDRLGVLGGNPAGYPNGRRPMDDISDIPLKVFAGAVQPIAGLAECPAALFLGDSLDGPTVPVLDRFPYLALPYQSYLVGTGY